MDISLLPYGVDSAVVPAEAGPTLVAALPVSRLEANETYYVVSHRWWNDHLNFKAKPLRNAAIRDPATYKAYLARRRRDERVVVGVGLVQACGITNVDLLDSTLSCIIDDPQVVLFVEKDWNALIAKYGGGPAIVRETFVADSSASLPFPSKPVIDLTGFTVTVFTDGEESQRIPFNASCTVIDVERVVRRRFGSLSPKRLSCTVFERLSDDERTPLEDFDGNNFGFQPCDVETLRSRDLFMVVADDVDAPSSTPSFSSCASVCSESPPLLFPAPTCASPASAYASLPPTTPSEHRPIPHPYLSIDSPRDLVDEEWGGGVDIYGASPIVTVANLGNTCYLTATLECLWSLTPFTDALREKNDHVFNGTNPLGTNGVLARAFCSLTKLATCAHVQGHQMLRVLHPHAFKRALDECAPQFAGTAQHDCQELVNFLLDALHEDFNEILFKPYTPKPEKLKDVSDADYADEYVRWFAQRNQSFVSDLFCGFFRSTLTCVECTHVSKTLDPFTCVQLPIPYIEEDEETQFTVLIQGDETMKFSSSTSSCATYFDVRRVIAARIGCDLSNVFVFSVRTFYVKHDDDVFDRDDDVYACAQPLDEESRRILFGYLWKNARVEAARVREVSTCVDANDGVLIPTGGRASRAFRPREVFVGTLDASIVVVFVHDEFSLELVVVERQDVPYSDKTSKTYALEGSGDRFRARKSFSGSPTFLCGEFTDGFFVGEFENKRIVLTRARFEPLNQTRMIVLTDRVSGVSCVEDEDFTFRNALEAYEDEGNIYGVNGHFPLRGLEHTSTTFKKRRLSFAPTAKLADLFVAFQRSEILGATELWSCSQCGVPRRVMKRLEFWSLPPCFVVQLKRFTHASSGTTKNASEVDFSFELVLTSASGNSATYELVGVSNHFGSLHGGHYTSFVRRGTRANRVWFEIDDRRATRVDAERIVSSAAYVLYYIKST